MKNRVITLQDEKERIISSCDSCNVAMVDESGKPYVIPMNFGYHNHLIYLHSSQRGKKIDILKKNNSVCVSFSTDHLLRWQSEKVACSYSMKYRSVLAFGYVEFIEEMSDRTNYGGGAHNAFYIHSLLRFSGHISAFFILFIMKKLMSIQNITMGKVVGLSGRSKIQDL